MTVLHELNNSIPCSSFSNEKQKFLTFFKSYTTFLKKLVKNSNPLKNSRITIFDLKKTAKSISLQNYLQRIFSFFKCGPEAYICALCFIDRLLESDQSKSQNFNLTSSNIYKIISVALLLATKSFDDFYYSNKYYARVCGLSLQQLNELEKSFLQFLGFNTFISNDHYQIYEKLLQIYEEPLISGIQAIADSKDDSISPIQKNQNHQINEEKINCNVIVA